MAASSLHQCNLLRERRQRSSSKQSLPSFASRTSIEMALLDSGVSIRPAVKLDQTSDSPIFSRVSFRTDARWGIRTRSSLWSDKLLIQACHTADKFFLLLWFSRTRLRLGCKGTPNSFV